MVEWLNTNIIGVPSSHFGRSMWNSVVEESESNFVEQAVACAPVMQRAQVRSPVGTSFLGEIGALAPHGLRISFGHHNHQYSFIMGANDLRY